MADDGLSATRMGYARLIYTGECIIRFRYFMFDECGVRCRRDGQIIAGEIRARIRTIDVRSRTKKERRARARARDRVLLMDARVGGVPI